MNFDPESVFCVTCRWRMHKWHSCILVPDSVRRGLSGAGEDCGDGLQTRGGFHVNFRSHSISLAFCILLLCFSVCIILMSNEALTVHKHYPIPIRMTLSEDRTVEFCLNPFLFPTPSSSGTQPEVCLGGQQ